MVGFDYFDFLRGVPSTGTQEELGGSQLPGAPSTRTQDNGGTQPTPGGLPKVTAGGARSSYLVAGSTVAVAMATPPAADSRRRQIHRRDQLR
jgi:hypothetical protein